MLPYSVKVVPKSRILYPLRKVEVDIHFVKTSETLESIHILDRYQILTRFKYVRMSVCCTHSPGRRNLGIDLKFAGNIGISRMQIEIGNGVNRSKDTPTIPRIISFFKRNKKFAFC